MAQEITPIVLGRNATAQFSTASHKGLTSFDSAECYIDFGDSTQNNQQGRFIILFQGDTGDKSTADSTRPFKLRVKKGTGYTGSGIGDYRFDIDRSTNSKIYTATGAHKFWQFMVGPLETARYLDSDRHVTVAWSTQAVGAAGGATGATEDTERLRVYAIVIP